MVELMEESINKTPEAGKKAYKIQQSVKKSKLQRYQELVIGSGSLGDLVKYELIILLTSWIPGALGIFLRGKLYPLLLGKTGSGVIFGSNIVLRHPRKIFLGDNIIIDDNVMIDAKGTDNIGITLEKEVFIGRNSILSCKGGNIVLRERANIGFNCEIYSSDYVEIGADTLLAAYTYIVGGGNYKLDRKDIPISHQPDFESKGGIIIDKGVWIGAHCVILDGVKVGEGSVVAAGAVVNKEVPAMSIAAGVPAKVVKDRL
jgi:acetyltransferase-like isoleucine patch superfamily enzyme